MPGSSRIALRFLSVCMHHCQHRSSTANHEATKHTNPARSATSRSRCHRNKVRSRCFVVGSVGSRPPCPQHPPARRNAPRLPQGMALRVVREPTKRLAIEPYCDEAIGGMAFFGLTSGISWLRGVQFPAPSSALQVLQDPRRQGRGDPRYGLQFRYGRGLYSGQTAEALEQEAAPLGTHTGDLEQL